MPVERLPFDLRSLQVFVAICENKTMAHAAVVLGLTQPAVSQIVQELEAHLGVALFDRAMRPMTLTPAGTLLRGSADSLIADARAVASQVQKCRRGYLPSIRLGLIYSLQRVLSVRLAQAMSTSADEVIVLNGITSSHATALLTRQLDLCIGVDDLPMEAGLDRWPIVNEPYVLVISPKIVDEDLASLVSAHPLVRYSARSMDGLEIDRYLRRSGYEIPRGLEFDTPFGLTEMVAAGAGWAVSTPLCLLEAGIPLEEVVIRPLPHNRPSRTITLVCRHKELGEAAGKAAGISIQTIRDQSEQTFAGPESWMLKQMTFGPDVVREKRGK